MEIILSISEFYMINEIRYTYKIQFRFIIIQRRSYTQQLFDIVLRNIKHAHQALYFVKYDQEYMYIRCPALYVYTT